MSVGVSEVSYCCQLCLSASLSVPSDSNFWFSVIFSQFSFMLSVVFRLCYVGSVICHLFCVLYPVFCDLSSFFSVLCSPFGLLWYVSSFLCCLFLFRFSFVFSLLSSLFCVLFFVFGDLFSVSCILYSVFCCSGPPSPHTCAFLPAGLHHEHMRISS